jgi:hypothetical protein
MYRAALFLLLPVVTATTAFAQSVPPDSPALQALVSEIRQLRQEMQATTVAAQRVQIALFRMQAQTAAVARAASRLDDAKSKVSEAQAHHAELTARMHHMEEAQRSIQDQNELKALAEALPIIKIDLERVAAEELRWQASEADGASQLRTEQAKLNDLQDLLDRLDKILDGYSKK